MQLQPMNADAELPKELKERHGKIKATLEGIEQRSQKAGSERNALRGSLAGNFDLKKMERVRILRAELLTLLQNELQTRAELTAWLTESEPAFATLESSALEAVKESKAKLMEKLESIGFDKALNSPANKQFLNQLLHMHPEVIKRQERVEKLHNFVASLINPFQEGSWFKQNQRRMEVISAELSEAIKQNEQFVSMI